MFSGLFWFILQHIFQESRKEIGKLRKHLYHAENLIKTKRLVPEAYSKIVLLFLLNLSVLIFAANSGITSNYYGLLDLKQINFFPGMERIVVGIKTAEGAEEVKVNDSKILGDKIIFEDTTLSEERCQKNKEEKRNSSLCGEEQGADLFPPRPKQIAKKIIVVRRRSCAEENEHPSKSETKGKHMDEDCCPDPDEWPKPGCAYSAGDYKIMLKSR